MNLYRLKNELGIYYVIASDPTTAQKMLESKLDITDYGFFRQRKVTEIMLLAEEAIDSKGDPFFSPEKNLILKP